VVVRIPTSKGFSDVAIEAPASPSA
jgi:hypothetical protein